jgi:hypothetical protein
MGKKNVIVEKGLASSKRGVAAGQSQGKSFVFIAQPRAAVPPQAS